MKPTHIQYLIHLECKQCGHKGDKTYVLKFGSSVHIGCDACKLSHTTFKVRKLVSWTSSSDDMYIKITIP